MLDGYAQSASRPPAFPDAADAIEVASSIVILWRDGLYRGCRVKKYAVAQPMMPPPGTRQLDHTGSVACIVSCHA